MLIYLLVVKFHHRSVFPVHFRKDVVKQWWVTDLIFKIYSRKSDQKKVSGFWLNLTNLFVWLENTIEKAFINFMLFLWVSLFYIFN